MAHCLYLIIFVAALLFQNIWAIPNPAAAYCKLLGYPTTVKKDSAGNENTFCTLPNGQEVRAWPFFRGQVAKEYSYCAKYGYDIITDTIDRNGWTEVCPVCVDKKDLSRIKLDNLIIEKGDELYPGHKNSVSEDTSFIKPLPKPRLSPLSKTLDYPSWDWRNYNGKSYVNVIRDQGDCGSCYAFAAVSAAEGVYNIVNQLDGFSRAQLSESFIMWCLGRLYSGNFYGCDGADWDYKQLPALTVDGICDSTHFLYTTSDPGSCTHWTDPRMVFGSWGRVSCYDTSGMKNAIMNYGPIDVAVDATGFHNYESGVYSDMKLACTGDPCYETYTNHAVSLVGWTWNSPWGFAWILRNSWGTDWGNFGYMYIAPFAARISCEAAYLSLNSITITQNTTLGTDQTRIYSAKNSISLSSSGHYFIVDGNGSTGAGVTLKTNANGSITLNEGFWAKEGSDVTIFPDASLQKRRIGVQQQIKSIQSDQLDKRKTGCLNCAVSYPNPFNPVTTVKYSVPFDGGQTISLSVSLNIYDVKGQLVRTLINGRRSSGEHIKMWDGKNTQGHNVKAGVYFANLAIGLNRTTLKLFLIR